MQIAKGGGRNTSSSPESIHHVNFLEASDDNASNIVDDVLNRVAEYVEPAASKTTEIIDALNRVVVGNDENDKKQPKRKSFMDALNQASSNKNDETLSVTDLDAVVMEKPNTRFTFSSKDISSILEQSMEKSVKKDVEREEENSNPLTTTSQYVEPTYAEILSSVFRLIDSMEESIHRFELTGTAQSLPDSPRQLCDRNEIKSKTEQLLNRLLNKSPIHKRPIIRTKAVSVPRESEKLIAKLSLQIDRLRKNRTGTMDQGGNDVLDSAREKVKDPVSESRSSSVAPDFVSHNSSQSGSVDLPEAFKDKPEPLKIPAEIPKRETREQMKSDKVIPKTVVPEQSVSGPVESDHVGGLGLDLPPRSPEIIVLGTEVAGPSDTSSIEDELFFASSKDTAKKGRRLPWKAAQDKPKVRSGPNDEIEGTRPADATDKPENPSNSNSMVPDMSPSRSRALSPKHYCVKCSRLLSYSPRRIRDNVLDRLAREEAIKWKRCQACVERMFPSLFDPYLKRIVDTEGLISFEEGELLYELSGRAEIPIRWEHKGDKKEFVSALHLVLFEMATNKDVVRKVASNADLNNLIEKDRIKFVDDAESRIGAVLKSVCQLQVDQHPLLAHLLNRYHNVQLHVPEIMDYEVDKHWLAPFIGGVWCALVGSIAEDPLKNAREQS